MSYEIIINEGGVQRAITPSMDSVFSIKVINGGAILVSGNASGLVEIAKVILDVAQTTQSRGSPHTHIDPGIWSTADSKECIIMLDQQIE